MKIKLGIKYLFGICLFPICVGCNDELDSPSSSGSGLCFTATENVHREVGTRSSSGGDSLLSSNVTSLEVEGHTLYLHTTVTDGIDGSHLGKDEALTRATLVSDMSTYGSFSVFAAFYQGAWSPVSQNLNFMYNVPVSLSGSVWSPQPDYYWPGSGYNVRFYAYAPIDAEFAPKQHATANDFFIQYEVPTDVSKQKDLLIAKSAEYAGNHGSIVPLEFKHVLTAVRFVVGDDMKAGTVNKVRLRNITSGGVYHPETGYVGKLVGQGIVKDFEQELNKVTDGTPGTAITEPFQTFMLPPQGFTDDNSVIEIVFTDDEGEHTLSASLKDQMWNSGTTVTYKISTSSINWDYHLDVTGPSEYSYAGGTDVYKVTSYRKHYKGKKEPVAWTTEFSTDNGATWTTDKPDWLTYFITSGQGSTASQSFNATVGAQTGIIEASPYTAALRAAAPKGSAGQPYNLSNTTGNTRVENTANCYVVGAPGYYSFPLVYGNAIKNGATNTSAYTTANSGPNILSTFINHTGNGITDPYIAKNASCIPAKAELVWQDALSLVSDIKYNSDINGGNISFKVDKSSIRQGNAVIAVKDAKDQILWSWHIWVTDEDIDKTIEVTNHQGKQYRFMPIFLGWCDVYTKTYAERSCKVKFTAGGKSQEITIKQTSNSITTSNHPYYQWGRKDPFLPSNGLADANKTWYDKAGNASTDNPATENLSTGATCIKNYILKPNVMQSNVSGDALYQNLWSADNNVYTANDNLVVKTIYDPSPVGFKLPASNAFTGFTVTGEHVGNPSEVNGIWDSSLKGWNFYTDPSRNKTIFFPASGLRDYNGRVEYVDNYGYGWSAGPYDQKQGFNMGFTSWSVSTLSNGGDRYYGMGVRPIHE